MRRDWSPHGRILFAFHSEAKGHPVMIDPADGSWEVLDQLVDGGPPIHAWQRKAP